MDVTLDGLTAGLSPGGALQVERAWQLLERLAPDGGEALHHPRRVAACAHRGGSRDGDQLAGALLHDALEAGVVALAEIVACAGRGAADAADMDAPLLARCDTAETR